MAYPVKTEKSTSAASSFTITAKLPPHVANDLLLVAVNSRFGGTYTTPTGGWTSLGTFVAGSDETAVYYLIASGSTTTDPAIAYTGNQGANAVATNFRGVDGTTPIPAAEWASSTTTVNKSIFPSVTPVDSNALICFIGSSQSFFDRVYFAPGIGSINSAYDSGSQGNIIMGYTYHQGGTATPQHEAWQQYDGTYPAVKLTITIKDDGNGEVGGYTGWSTSLLPAVLYHAMTGDAKSGHIAITGEADMTTLVPTITNSESSVTQTTINKGFSGNFSVSEIEPLITNTEINMTATEAGKIAIRGSQLTSAVDLSGEILSFRVGNILPVQDTIDNLGTVLGISDGTNAKTWTLDGIDSLVSSKTGTKTYQIEIEGGTEIDTHGPGTINLANVDTLYTGWIATDTTNENHIWGHFYLLRTMYLLGGSTTLPCSFTTAYEFCKAGELQTIHSQLNQTKGQFYAMQSLNIGDGSDAVFWKSSNQSVEFPAAYNYSDKFTQSQISSAAYSLTIKGSANCNIDLGSTTLNFGDYHQFIIDSATSSSATYNFSGLSILNSTPTLNSIGSAASGIFFSGCKEVSYTTLLDLSGGNTFNGCVDAQQLSITGATQAALQLELDKLDNCAFTNATGIALNIDFTGTGDVSLTMTGMTFSGNATDVNYDSTNASTLTIADDGSGILEANCTVTGAAVDVLITAPSTSITVNSDVASSDIKIFDGTSQTEVSYDSNDGSTAVFTFTGTKTFYYTVMKAGYLPQRGNTGAITASATVNVTLADDEIYDASHGLTFTTDYSYNATTRVMTIVAAQQGRDLYSALIDDFISETGLNNKPFPIVAVGPDRFDFTSDGTTAATIDSGDVQFWRGAGMDWEHATTGNRTHGYCALKGTGTNAASTKGYYQQVDGAAPTALSLVSNNVDQVVQYYSDPNGDGSTADGYDRSGHLVAKLFNDGYYQKSIDVVDFYGLTAIESFEYILPMQMISTGLGTGTRGITITVTDNTPAGVVEQPGYTFDYKVEGGASDSPEDLLRQWIFDIFTDPTASTYATKINFNWPDPIAESGGIYQTERGLVYGQDTTTTLHGFYVEEGADYHPDFLQQQSNDGTFFVTPVPTPTLIVNSDIAASDIKIFDANLQTVEASATGLTASTTTAGTYDITVMKGGYLPQRQTGITLGSESVTVNISLTPDPVYVSGHGLTWSATSSPTAGQVHYDESTRIMYLADNQEGRNIYSALIDFFIAQSALYNTPFPLSAVGPDRIDFNAVGRYNTTTTVGATIETNDVTFWKGAGMVWEHDTTGNPTKKFYSVKTSNTLQASSVVGYTQQNAGTPIEATLVSNQVNQVIQFFEDTNGDGTPDYEYTSHLLFKGFLTGYYQARWDVVNDGGIATLEPYEYTIALLQDAIAGATGTQGVTITTLTNHTSLPITVGGKSFDYELVDPASTTAQALLAQINFDIYTAVNGAITNTVWTTPVYNAFDLPDLIIEAGTSYETEAGYFEFDGLVDDRSGIYLSRSGDHPDISRFQSNDLSYYEPAQTATVTINNITTTSRVQLYDTVNLVELYNDIPGTTSYQFVETYSVDRTVRVRITDVVGATAKLMIEAVVGSISSSNYNISYNADQQDDDTYNTNGIDGSTVTGITIDDTTDLVNINIAGGSVTWPQIYAYEVYWLDTATGIRDDFAFINAPDTANYILTSFQIKNTHPTSAPLVISGGYGRDSVTGASVDLVDTAGADLIFAPDHVVPFSTGSGLTASQDANLIAIKGQTDKFGFNVRNEVQADMKSTNGEILVGDGSLADKFRSINEV